MPPAYFPDRFAEGKRYCSKTERSYIQGGGVSGTDRHAGLPKLRVSAAVENYFDPVHSSSGRYSHSSEGLKRSMIQALSDADLKTKDIDYICAAANSVQNQDRLETAAIKEVFGSISEDVPVSSIKSMIGETVSAAGILQIAAALGAMENNFIPPTINYKEPDPACGLDYVPNKKREKTLKNVLINNFGPGGNNASAIIKKYS